MPYFRKKLWKIDKFFPIKKYMVQSILTFGTIHDILEGFRAHSDMFETNLEGFLKWSLKPPSRDVWLFVIFDLFSEGTPELFFKSFLQEVLEICSYTRWILKWPSLRYSWFDLCSDIWRNLILEEFLKKCLDVAKIFRTGVIEEIIQSLLTQGKKEEKLLRILWKNHDKNSLNNSWSYSLYNMNPILKATFMDDLWLQSLFN